MQSEEIKSLISDKTGIPVNLIPGETPEECIAGAKALLAYRERANDRPKSGREQFEAWIKEQAGIEEEPESPISVLNEIENSLRAYPVTRDGGEVTNMPDPRSTREQFGDWFYDVSAYNPFKGEATRKHVI